MSSTADDEGSNSQVPAHYIPYPLTLKIATSTVRRGWVLILDVRAISGKRERSQEWSCELTCWTCPPLVWLHWQPYNKPLEVWVYHYRYGRILQRILLGKWIVPPWNNNKISKIVGMHCREPTTRLDVSNLWYPSFTGELVREINQRHIATRYL